MPCGRWSRWNPISNIPNEKLYVDELTDGIGEERLKIKLSNEDESFFLEISFWHPTFYMYTDEGKRIRTLVNLREKYGKGFHSSWTLFKVEDSEILSWAYAESGLKDIIQLQHYVIMAADEFIDIISEYEPEVTMHRKE